MNSLLARWQAQVAQSQLSLLDQRQLGSSRAIVDKLRENLGSAESELEALDIATAAVLQAFPSASAVAMVSFAGSEGRRTIAHRMLRGGSEERRQRLAQRLCGDADEADSHDGGGSEIPRAQLHAGSSSVATVCRLAAASALLSVVDSLTVDNGLAAFHDWVAVSVDASPPRDSGQVPRALTAALAVSGVVLGYLVVHWVRSTLLQLLCLCQNLCRPKRLKILPVCEKIQDAWEPPTDSMSAHPQLEQICQLLANELFFRRLAGSAAW